MSAMETLSQLTLFGLSSELMDGWMAKRWVECERKRGWYSPSSNTCQVLLSGSKLQTTNETQT